MVCDVTASFVACWPTSIFAIGLVVLPSDFSSALEASPKFATMQWPPTVDERYSLAILSS